MKIELTTTEAATMLAALNLATEQWRADAATMHTNAMPRLAQQFQTQALVATDLIDKLEP